MNTQEEQQVNANTPPAPTQQDNNAVQEKLNNEIGGLKAEAEAEMQSLKHSKKPKSAIRVGAEGLGIAGIGAFVTNKIGNLQDKIDGGLKEVGKIAEKATDKIGDKELKQLEKFGIVKDNFGVAAGTNEPSIELNVENLKTAAQEAGKYNTKLTDTVKDALKNVEGVDPEKNKGVVKVVEKLVKQGRAEAVNNVNEAANNVDKLKDFAKDDLGKIGDKLTGNQPDAVIKVANDIVKEKEANSLIQTVSDKAEYDLTEGGNFITKNAHRVVNYAQDHPVVATTAAVATGLGIAFAANELLVNRPRRAEIKEKKSQVEKLQEKIAVSEQQLEAAGGMSM